MEKIYQQSLDLHARLKGKIEIRPKAPVVSRKDLSLAYTPGVAEPCRRIAAESREAWKYTIKGNCVAVVTDGSAVLGLGNIGPLAALPVMEGKAMLFKRFAGIDAFPICLDTQDQDEIVSVVRNISPVFGGINLEDISAPRSFFIEQHLQDLGIPVFHDDQHGTAIVVLAALINACRVLNKKLSTLRIVISGAGAAGIAIARFLRCRNHEGDMCIPVKDLIVCDSRGIIHSERRDLNFAKKELLRYSNPSGMSGSLKDAVKGRDVFIGVSAGNLLNADDIGTMSEDPVVFALANPVPEIMPEEALKGGAAIAATGRSDFPNQINNLLCFPGIFRGALDARAASITSKMKIAAAHAIAGCVEKPATTDIIPFALDEHVVSEVARAVKEAAC